MLSVQEARLLISTHTLLPVPMTIPLEKGWEKYWLPVSIQPYPCLPLSNRPWMDTHFIMKDGEKSRFP